MNDGDQALSFIYLLGMLALVGSGLAVRRMPIGQTMKMAAGWVLIFLAIFAAFTLREDFLALGKRVLADGGSETTPVQVGESTRIRQSADGHFWVDAQLNGRQVRFLIDSGATTTSLSTATARRAGVEAAGGLPAIVQTANGTVSVQRGRADRLVVGSIVREDLAVHVSEAFGEMNVLGMNFLSSLSGWGVEGRSLILKP